MGLDISAYSWLRFTSPELPEEYADDDVAVFTTDGFDRLDGKLPGHYKLTRAVHVWWREEHGTADIPQSEVVPLEERIAKLRDGAIKAECPGDLAVLAADCPVSEDTGFRAGSYSGYNWWREQLCQLALDVPPDDVWGDPEHYAGKPFVELINFSDCEGCIGPITAAKLAVDFREYGPRVRTGAAKQITDDEERSYFLDTYNDWQQAFEIASRDGFVIFH
jgi:hypothetical protein